MENEDRNVFNIIWMQMQAFSYGCTSKLYSNVIIKLMDLIIFIFFLITGTVVLLSTQEITIFHYANIIQKQFVERPFYNEYGFEMKYKDIVSVADWWTFIETTFVESISQFSDHNGDTNITTLKNHFLLGGPRLRQIRVDNSTCLIHNAFRKQFQTCYGEYTKSNEERNNIFNKTQSTGASTNIYPIRGEISTYGGDGYIETLSSTTDEINATLEKLKTLRWIDRGTRMILIELITFNANVNLFCNIKFLIEFTPSGGILTSSTIQPLHYSIACDEFFECFCALLFFVITLFYTLKLILRVKIMGVFSIFNSIWIILDIIVTSLVHLSFFYIVWHTKYLTKLLKNEGHKFKDTSFSLEVICYWNTLFKIGLGTCTFLAWVKIFEYIQLNKTMLQFSSTFKKCGESLFGFIVMFAIVFVAYADLSVLLFGTNHVDFRDFSTALMTMMRMVLGDLYYSEIEESSPILGPIYFLSYILFVFFILLNMFLAIINDTFSDVKNEITIDDSTGFKEYKKQLLLMFGKGNFASNTTSHFRDKPDEEQYSNEKKDIVNSVFTSMSKQKAVLELNELSKRIVILEKYIDKLLIHLENTSKANRAFKA